MAKVSKRSGRRKEDKGSSKRRRPDNGISFGIGTKQGGGCVRGTVTFPTITIEEKKKKTIKKKKKDEKTIMKE